MSRNPILNDQAFGVGANSPSDEWRNAQAGSAAGTTTAAAADAATASQRGAHLQQRATDGKVMTMGGVAAATGVLFGVLLVTAFFGWQSVTVTQVGIEAGQPVFSASPTQPILLFLSVFAGLGLAILTAFKPHFARITAPLYAAVEGYFLGAISAIFGAQFEGIVPQAVLATFGVFIVMLALYGLRILRATPKFVKGVIAATFGIAFMYLGIFILNIFGVAEGFWSSGSPLGIGISLVVVCVAALNLILDFDFIEQGSKAGLPRYMDWYGAFGLLVTLIWLYLEMLRLLARLRQ
ncbi:MAG: Bax inhibitor-1/YccA family protein [Actinobacteria bacterium]|nr:Bax inhibitor-1/YccA family protein [Actinomycetota bacterium]